MRPVYIPTALFNAIKRVNEAGQANMDVGTAVSVWKQYIDPLKNEGYKLLAPVTSVNPDGFMWVQQFLEECSGCQVCTY